MKKTLLICFLALCMLFSACGGGTSKGPGGTTPENTLSTDVHGFVEGGIHNYEIKPTGKNIIEKGSTQYKVLIPENADDTVTLAAKELVSFVAEATGVSLDTATAAEEGGKYISLGQTALAETSGVAADPAVVGHQGFIIRTVNDNVFIQGAESLGTLYGVYSYLEKELSFDWFTTSTYSLDETDTLPLNEYNATDVPDMGYRLSGYGYISRNKENMNRMRYNDGNDFIIPVGGNLWHNSFNYFPKADYQEKHPDIYADDGTQLCYTAHGDEEELQWMVDTATNVMIESFKANPDKNLITLSIEDTMTSCTCETCTQYKEKYNADSAAIIIFLNRISKEVGAWMETAEGKPYARDYRILFFAYHQTNAAPVHYDAATDTFTTVDDKVVLDSHIAPYFAETNGDYTQNYYDEGTANTEIAYNMRGWSAISNELYFWSYDTNFTNYLIPYNSFGAVQDIYKFAFELGTDFIFTQGQWSQTNATTGFGTLKGYLVSKLGWDVNVDVEALTQKFFDGTYGDASAYVYNVYKEYRVLAAYQTDEMGYKGSRSIFMNALQEKFWPKNLLARWIDQLYQGIDSLEPLKTTDVSLYDKLVNNVELELVSFLYLYVELYGNVTDLETVNLYKTECKRIIESIGLTLYAERNAPVSTIFTSWGLND